MNLRVERMNKTWLMGEGRYAHLAVIGEDRIEDSVNADFALVVFYEKEFFGYMTVRFIGDMAFMPYGGIFPEFRSQKLAQQGFNLMVDELKKLKPLVGFETYQDNVLMQILGLKKGFVVSGVAAHNGRLKIQMVLEGDKNGSANTDLKN